MRRNHYGYSRVQVAVARKGGGGGDSREGGGQGVHRVTF